MKKFSVACLSLLFVAGLCSCCWGGVQINSDNFPDPIFQGYVMYHFDANSNDVLDDDEIDSALIIDVSYLGIKTLTGIENFSRLMALDCSSTDITDLDLSQNKYLTILYCTSNDLTTLDVSNNLYLSELDCSYNALTSLTLGSKKAYETMDFDEDFALKIDCSHNQLTALDLSECTSLVGLECSYNELTELNLKNNTYLQILGCMYNELNAIDVSSNTNLTHLECVENKLSSLNVSSNTKLVELVCGSNDIKTLNLENNADLEFLNAVNVNISMLDVTNNKKLNFINCALNYLTKIDLSKNTELETLYCQGNYLRSLDLSANEKLELLDCRYNELLYLDLNKNTSLASLQCELNMVKTLKANTTNDSEYPYEVNMSDYVGDRFSKISNLKAYDKNDKEIPSSYTQSTGVLKISSTFAYVAYDYDLGYTGTASATDVPRVMNVMIAVMDKTLILPEYTKTDDYDMNVTLDSTLKNAIAGLISGVDDSEVFALGSIVTQNPWEADESTLDEGVSLLFAFPEVKANADGAYVILCKFGDDVKAGDEIMLVDFSTNNASYEFEASATPEYYFLNANNEKITKVPDNKEANLAVKLSSGQTFRGGVVSKSSSSGGLSSSGGGGCNSGLNNILLLSMLLGLIVRRKTS